MAFLDRVLHRPVSLETQLQVLAECGIRLHPDVTVNDLLFSSEREQYEKQPYRLLLCVLGSESERDPTSFLCDDIGTWIRSALRGRPGTFVSQTECPRLPGIAANV